MISYLINSTLCSSVLLAVYYLLLQNKVIYSFNRLYLLLSVVFSLIVPLISVEQDAPVIESGYNYVNQYIIKPSINANLASSVSEIRTSDTYPDFSILWCGYAVITSALLFRFAKNLYIIKTKISRNEAGSYKGAKLVLTDDRLIPHSFLNYIFLNKEEYNSKRIEDSIMRHELTHVQQGHSVDIILIELVQIFYWINPLILLYQNAIRLNHEFIADSVVLQTERNVSEYQYLIMSKLSETQGLTIASQLNYSLTKKRLIMMTRSTSRASAWVARLAVLPLMVIAFMLFCNMTYKADVIPVTIKKMFQATPVQDNTSARRPPLPPFVLSPLQSPKKPASQQVVNEYISLSKKYESPDYYTNKTQVPAADRSRMEKLFLQMNDEQRNKQNFVFGGQFLKTIPLLRPTDAQFESWKNAAVYGVWINEKHVTNEELTNYKASDFSNYDKSSLHYTEQNKKNIMKHFNLRVMYQYQIDLMTADYYEKTNAEINAERDKTVMYYVKNIPNGKSGLYILR